MADQGNIESMLSGLPDDQRRIFRAIFEYLIRDIRFGRAVDGDPSKNFGGGFFSATTDATPGTEFTIPHSFGRTPYLLIPVLPLDTVNATLVPLTVTRAADSNRIYLSSTSASASIMLYVEG
ncbi:MAG: hypothetical protein NUW01_12225 [Gemmatimonadaceae bacterium]|nr:hypothetical protein [Gemmatimonadaceae bacterium]